MDPVLKNSCDQCTRLSNWREKKQLIKFVCGFEMRQKMVCVICFSFVWIFESCTQSPQSQKDRQKGGSLTQFVGQHIMIEKHSKQQIDHLRIFTHLDTCQDI